MSQTEHDAFLTHPRSESGREVDGLQRLQARRQRPQITTVTAPAGETYHLVAGLPVVFSTYNEAEIRAELLFRKRLAEEINELPRTVGQVYHCAASELYFFHPSADQYATWQMADVQSLNYLCSLDLGPGVPSDVMADAGAETQVVEATFEQLPVQHHELTLSWYPVKDLCEQLTRNMVSANFVASFQRAERRSLEQLGRNAFMLMFHDAVMLMSISLLKALSQNPSAAGYDVCDVYAKLTLCCQWISFPDLESLRCLHRAVGHAVRGTPFGERWSDDFMPALTQARERLANGVVASPYRRIRRTDDGNPEEAVG